MSKDIDLDWIEKSGGFEWTPGSPWPPEVPDEERCSGDDYQHSKYYYDYTRNDPDRENPFTEAFDHLMAESVTGKTPWIYESPDGGVEDIISTRRLVHIVRAYSIFNNKAKAIQVCVNRFDDETKQSFLELYDKVDADFQLPVKEEHG